MKLLTQSQLDQYNENGYYHYARFFDQEEIRLLYEAAHKDRELQARSHGKADGEGGNIRLSLWNHPGDTIFGMFARCERMVNNAEAILADEVYHYHSKMILKDPKIGGAWTWHQDYGYWYQNGVLFPDLVSISIAIDPATKENGCLQVIKGSHKMGRVNHILSGDQAGADLERVDEALKRLDHVYVKMDAGDVLFFHPNLLHRSDRNNSSHSRWSMICCYNAKHNDPYKESHHPRYTPLHKVPDSAIKETGLALFEEGDSQSDWWKPDVDESAKSLQE